MAKAETPSTRAPRGAKPVAQAFLTALDAIPEASRAAVVKAAQTMIKDEMKLRKDKTKAAAAKEKARKPVAAKAAKPAPKAAAAKPAAAKANGAEPVTVPVKRRARKAADVPTTA